MTQMERTGRAELFKTSAIQLNSLAPNMAPREMSTGQKLTKMPVDSNALQRAKQGAKNATTLATRKGGTLSSGQLACLLWKRWECHLSTHSMDGVTFDMSKAPVVIGNRADDDSKFKRNADSNKERYYAALNVNYEFQASANFWTATVPICIIDDVYIDLHDGNPNKRYGEEYLTLGMDEDLYLKLSEKLCRDTEYRLNLGDGKSSGGYHWFGCSLDGSEPNTPAGHTIYPKLSDDRGVTAKFEEHNAKNLDVPATIDKMPGTYRSSVCVTFYLSNEMDSNVVIRNLKDMQWNIKMKICNFYMYEKCEDIRPSVQGRSQMGKNTYVTPPNASYMEAHDNLDKDQGEEEEGDEED